ncbi:MAG: hypothetical protein ACJ748_12755 [Flavisolibacter sp.]
MKDHQNSIKILRQDGPFVSFQGDWMVVTGTESGSVSGHGKNGVLLKDGEAH